MKITAAFNSKIKLGVEGRKETFSILEKQIDKNRKSFWFHCASLGEYEQGLPVFEVIKGKYPTHQIVLTFFSPSGYEVRKNSKIADIVVYLPIDTKANAKRFLDIVKPDLTVFVKYDIWPNYLIELKKQNLKAILISAAYRKNQSFFKWYGSLMRKALSAFEHIFVQNISSEKLLKTINFSNVTVSGDTRFDRVSNQLLQNNIIDFIAEFKQESLCVVIGSSWPEDEAILIPYINQNASSNIKFIIAPHNINPNHIEGITSKLKTDYVLFSEKEHKKLNDYSVFIIDTIGLLTKIYSYANIAYIGGAMGSTGLHNILEPAVFGIPVIIGKNHDKFPEAQDMIEKAGVLSISNENQLAKILNNLIHSSEKRNRLGAANKNFIKNNKGAVIQITDYIRI